MNEVLIYLDTETSGLDEPVKVCECAFIELDPDLFTETARHHSLIDPERPIRASASGIHHITDDMVQDSPTLAQWFDQVLGNPFTNLPNDTTVYMAAHNAKFDHPLVAEHLGKNVRLLCTLKLAQRVYPDAEDFKLSTLKYLFGIAKGASHNALADVEAGVGLLQKIVADTGMTLDELHDYQSSPRILKTMPFGKHKGQPISEVPAGWVRWYRQQDEQDQDIVDTFNHYFPPRGK